jgi:hypothetical protein
VVLSRPDLNVQVSSLPVQDRNLAVATVNSGGNQFVMASMHAPDNTSSRSNQSGNRSSRRHESSGQYDSAGRQFTIHAAREAEAASVDVLMGDTNIYGGSAPRTAERVTRSATRTEDLPGYQEVPIGPTSTGGNHLDRVYEASHSSVSVAAAGRILSSSGSSTRRVTPTGNDVTVSVDASTQRGVAGSVHTPIYAELEHT